MPRGAGIEEMLLAGAFAKVVEAQGGDADFAFQLRLDEEGFADSASGDLSAYWRAMVQGVARYVAAREDVDADEAETRIDDITNNVRRLLGVKREEQN